ncbi:MAG: MerR family transcriptional regulator [Deltaproteobacteria bacterium]|nr:MerR family transcriptional regulator [Deltaproteobacteria bacterium]
MVRSDLIVWTQFLEMTGIEADRLREFMDLGWIEAQRTAQNEIFLFARDVRRIRKAQRLCCDFELTTVGVTIIIDLLDRIESLEQEVRQLRRLLD